MGSDLKSTEEAGSNYLSTTTYNISLIIVIENSMSDKTMGHMVSLSSLSLPNESTTSSAVVEANLSEI